MGVSFESETARCIQVRVRVGKRERGVTASASERRLASHLLRRQSMTLPSTVEERTTIYTHTHTKTLAKFRETRSHPPNNTARGKTKATVERVK